MAKTTFVDGDPGIGQLGTIVNAAFLNLIFNHQHDGVDSDGHAPVLLDNVKTVSATYQVAGNDMVILADATTAAFTITLPDAAVVGAGRKYFCKKIDAAVNAVTLACTGAQTIDGVATTLLRATNDSIILISDGTNWRIFKVPLTLDSVTNVTSTYAITGADMVVFADATGGAFTITLPDATAVGAGRKFIIKKIDNTVNAVTLTPNGAQTIDGATNAILTSQNDALILVSDGTNFNKISSNPLLYMEITLGAAVGSLSFPGLAGLAHGGYRLIAKMSNWTATSVIYLTFNGDPQNSTDYMGEAICSSFAPLISGGTVPMICTNSTTNGKDCCFIVDFDVLPGGRLIARSNYQYMDLTTYNMIVGIATVIKKTTVTDLISFTLSLTGTDTFPVNSKFTLFRRK